MAGVIYVNRMTNGKIFEIIYLCVSIFGLPSLAIAHLTEIQLPEPNSLLHCPIEFDLQTVGVQLELHQVN